MGDARSFRINIHNKTTVTWARGGVELDHGEWTLLPPENIQAGEYRWFRSASDGFATGTAGWVVYYPGDGETFLEDGARLNWNNPFIGGNEFNVDARGSTGRNYQFHWGDPGGEDAAITLTIQQDAGLPPLGEGVSEAAVEPVIKTVLE